MSDKRIMELKQQIERLEEELRKLRTELASIYYQDDLLAWESANESGAVTGIVQEHDLRVPEGKMAEIRRHMPTPHGAIDWAKAQAVKLPVIAAEQAAPEMEIRGGTLFFDFTKDP